MFSIENFYHILNSQLFTPLDMSMGIFSHFGSTDPDGMNFETFNPDHSRYGRQIFGKPMCVFHDQEPILPDTVERLFSSYSDRHLKILANSEHSAYKQELCRSLGYSDWYYFFHGLAALDWYRDAEYFNQNVAWARPYITLNHLCTNERSYRLSLVAGLVERGILHQGLVSLGTDFAQIRAELARPESRLSRDSRLSIYRNLKSLNLPLVLDKTVFSGEMSADFSATEFQLLKQGLWHVVTETVYYDRKLHLTEKVFKPIAVKRPFILAAAPGNLQYLKSYGFKTFSDWISEDYDLVDDPEVRMRMILDELTRICSMSSNELNELYKDMQGVLDYNFNHFYKDFKGIVLDELLINYETCIRQWNTSRVDDKMINVDDIDFTELKRIIRSER